MSSNKKYHKNYIEFNEIYQLVLPLSLEGLVPEDDSVRLLSHELEELDYTLLYQAYSAKGRKSVVDPKTMFKILTYAYSLNIYSSRKYIKNIALLKCAKNPGIRISFQKSGSWIRFFLLRLKTITIINYFATAPSYITKSP